MIERYVDAQELKRLLSVLVVIIGCLMIAALFASLIVPGLRNANRPVTPTAVDAVVGESGWLNPEEFTPQKGGVIPPVDPKSLLEPSPALVAHGKTLFESNCMQCHGAQGMGDGPAASTMNPKPRNFSSSEGWKNGDGMPDIYKTLTEGIKNTSMAAFEYLSRKDRMALVHYVQSLGKFDHKAGNPESVEALTKELGSAGEVLPNRIPVSMAMAKIKAEYVAAPALAVPSGYKTPGSEILRRIVRDPERAGQFLALAHFAKSSCPALADGIAKNAPANGFSVNSASLNNSEWQSVCVELLKQ
jgi:mono/diheme cytochrome c family protein